MACENKKTRRLSIIILCLMLCDLPLVAPKNIDCKGKPFHCVNSTNFIICVDLGGGISSTVDDVIIPCPESTICDINNYFECEFPPPTTLTLPIQPSDVSNESGLGKNKVITKVSWENIDIATTSPMQNTSERSEKYLNNVSITISEEFTTTKVKLEAITDIQSTTIQQDNINRQYQYNSTEKQYQQFTGNSIIDESSNLDFAQSDINKDENTNGTKLNSYTIDTRLIQTNEELKDRKLSSVGTGTKSTPLQSSMSPPDTTEFYSYTSNNRDVITFDSSFTTNPEMPTSDIISANKPILSNSISKSLQILKAEKETTPYAVTDGTITGSKKTITVQPKVFTLSYNSSNSSSKINNDNSRAAATLNKSNPINLVNEYQSSQSSKDTDNISYFDEFSVTESFTNITPSVLNKQHFQSNSTQDHVSSTVSKYLDSEQLNNTTDKYEQNITTNITGDIITRPNITEVQKGSASQENNDLSASNFMRTNQLMYTTDKQALTESINSSYINVSDNNKEMSKTIKNSQNLQETDKIRKIQPNLPVDYALKTVQDILFATDASIFATHKPNSVPQNQIKENITKINIHDETTTSDLNTNYYVTDSYGVNYDQAVKTFDEINFNKNGYTKSEVIYTTTNTYRTDEVTITTTEKNNEIIKIAMHNNTETTIKHNNTVKTAFPDYKIQNNKTSISKIHEQVAVENEIQKRISIPYIYNGTTISNLSNNYVNENTNTNNQYKSTQAIRELNSTKSDDLKNENTTNNSTNDFTDDKSIFTTTEPNIDVKSTDFDYKFQNNREIAKKELSNSAIDDLKSGRFYNNVSSSFENNKVIVTTIKPNIKMIKTEHNYNLEINREEATNNLSTTHAKDAVMHQPKKNITLFIHGEKAETDLNNKSYAKEDSSSKNQYQSTQTTNSRNDEVLVNQCQSTQTTNSGNDEVVVTTADSNIGIITTSVPNYNSQNNKEEATKNMSKTHEEGVVKHETQKNITTLFIHDGKTMTDLNNKNYAKEDSSNKNQHQSTQITNSGNDKVVVTTADSNIDMITKALPNNNFQNNNENTTNNVLKTHVKGVVIHETQRDIKTSFIQGEKAMTDLNNKSYTKEDSNRKNQYQSNQTINSGKEEVVVTTAESKIDLIRTTVPNYYSQKNEEETAKNMSKTHVGGEEKHETQKNITMLFIYDGKVMTDLNNKNYAKEDSSSKNQYHSTQTTNPGNDEVVVTTIGSYIDMITTLVPNYNSQINKEETTKNMSKTHDEGITQKNITTLFIHGGKAMSDLNNKNYAKEDSSYKNQHQSTPTKNSGNDEVVVTIANLNIGMITTALPNNNFQNYTENTINNVLKTHEKGVVIHETQRDIIMSFIPSEKVMTDLNNKSYAKKDSNIKNQYQSTQTTNSWKEEVVVTTAESNIDMITTTVPNYDLKVNKEETTKYLSKTHEAPKNITTIFIHDGKTMPDLKNKNYVKDVSVSKNQYQSTQKTNSGNDEVVVTTAGSNIDITKIVPNYDLKINKEETTKNMSKIHEEGVVKHETPKNITTLFIHDGKAMSHLNNKSYAKEDISSTNQFESTQTTNSGNDEVRFTTTESNITTPIIHGEKPVNELNNKSFARDKDSNIQYQSTQTSNQFNFTKNGVLKGEPPPLIFNSSTPNFEADKIIVIEHNTTITTNVPDFMSTKVDDSGLSTQTTNSGKDEVKFTTTELNITKPIIHGEKPVSDFNNKSFTRDKDNKIQYQSTQTSNQFNFTKHGVLKGDPPLIFNSSTPNFEADKILVIEHNTTITTNVPDFMFTKVDDSGLTTNLNHYTDTFVSTNGNNTYVTKTNIDIDQSDILDRFKTITHKNLQETELKDINGDEMAATQITNNLTFEPTSAPINELKISPKKKSSTPANTVEGTISANRDFVKTFGDGKLEKNDKPLSSIGQEINSRTNRQAEKQMEIFKLGDKRTTNKYNITTIIVSEYPPNSSQKYGEDLTATRVPKHADVNVLTKISEDFNSYTHKEIGITEKNTMLPVINAKNLTTVAEDFLTKVTTASFILQKKMPATSISKESMSGITYVNNGRQTTVSSSSSIMNMSTNSPPYDETKVVESMPLQISVSHSLNIEADTTIPSSESDKVTSVLNRAVNTRDVTLLKQNSHTENYQLAESTVLSLINLTSLSESPLNNKILDTPVTKTSVDTESATDISDNQPQQLNKTEKVSIKTYSNKTDAEINENKPQNDTIKSIQSRDITDSKASTISKAWRINENFRNESVLNNNQQPDILPSELSVKVGSDTVLHASTTEQNIAQMTSKHFTDIKQNTGRFLRKTTPSHYTSSTISSLEMSGRSITTAKIKKNTVSTIRNTNDMSDATLVTDSTINKRKKKSKAYDIGNETLVENMNESDGNISTTLNKYKDFSNISNSNTTINADEPSKKHHLISTTMSSGMMTQSPINVNTKPLTMMTKTEKEYLENRAKKLNKNFEIKSENTKLFVINDQNSYKEISVNSNYTAVSNEPQSVSKYYSNSTTRRYIKTSMKNTTTMAKRIRDVNAKSTNTAPTNFVVILFDYGRQRQRKEGKSVTNTEENPDDNINVESSSHNRYENIDPNDIIVEPMTNTNNADNDNDAQNSPTPKVDVRVNDRDMVLCGRYTRGRYPDKNDCRRFYVCVGRNPPIKGICPNNTVYSELRKQCTRNLSHCVRNNKFKCLTEGRFSDFLKHNIYHICIKNKLGAFAVYKFQCQNGFRLDKKTVKCIKETDNSSSSMSSASESSKSINKSTTEKTLKVTDKFECQEEGKFADTRDCRTYYVCSKKRNVYRRKKKKCESDERFDRDKKKCVDAESYECDI